jgi:hypothetical protein
MTPYGQIAVILAHSNMRPQRSGHTRNLVVSGHEWCYIDFAGNFPRVIARLSARDADFLQKGSRCTKDPLRSLRRLRFGLPAGLP